MHLSSLHFTSYAVRVESVALLRPALNEGLSPEIFRAFRRAQRERKGNEISLLLDNRSKWHSQISRLTSRVSP